MKVKALSRPQSTTTRSTPTDLRPTHKNLNPSSHPLPRAREYTRAVTAAKLDRMFASPFVGELRGGHVDAVNVLSTSRTNLLPVVSGGIDGSVRIWDLQNRKMVKSLEAHGRCVSGVVFGNGIEGLFYSCGEDGVVKGWFPAGRGNANSSLSFTSIDHHWSDSQFATSSSDAAVHLWDPERSTPITSFTNLWGSDDTVTTIRYNPAERSLLAHCSNDRGIGLHDTRASSALQKSILSMKSNSLEWNPMEPYMFVVGNEDYNAYTFDMRKLNRPTQMFKGHVAAVMSVSWSPTGTEFVTGSYDKTMRIFNVRKEGGTASHTGTNATGVARDIYHTKRMQRIFCTAYTLDHKFILSGSDDTNIRLWKARSSEKMGQLSAREESSLQYRQALVQKYVHLPEVKKIAKARRVPKFIKKQTEMERVQKEKRRRKEGNVVKHSKPGTKGFTDDKGKSVVKTVD
ncbi:hypothetical protein THAPSDRAFT_269352 [Thalassiosira pseudonana CCMP1335]|uniref:DDB1- and CUL4-associated factor 13 n=1 Tax=Thalassiosira pseudonana TaxID=35128 RepID=B8C6X0_THAPS|nr:hypothetical protein THAPSDRAFT_269352 [Thalassiosira pseudonana CCMP1335]EED90876.1 hypothetical protein THAPSDRAFT_269352 [Thalassiosira pseudonana CCMP1335]